MIRRPTNRRPGTSLLEVLVGLGIMAVGAISAFVLFPLSAINVSRAMIDDRATTCAITADGQLRDIHRQEAEREANGGAVTESYHGAMDNPGTGAPALLATEPGPSYPVFLDPMGRAAGRTTVGNGGLTPTSTTLVPRVDLNLLGGNRSLALRFCSQMDGLTFTEGGDVPSTNTFEMRELRYNWLWVLQRPSNRDRHTVRQQIMVFDKRAHLYAPPNSEAVFSATFAPGETVITGVATTAEVRKGTWVMDGTVGVDLANRPLRHAEFYRVTSVTEIAGNPPTFTLEIHKPVARPDGLVNLGNPLQFAYNGSLVVFPAAIEVFERPLLTGIGP